MTFSDELLLTGFAPLLQVWGGICLLFFYLELLQKSPLKGRWDGNYKRVRDCCTLLLTQYQDLSSRDKLIKLQHYIDQTTSSDYSTLLWETTRRSVYNLAKFGFFHISLLLLYMGFEKPLPDLFPILLIIDSIALAYILCSFLFYNKSFIQKSWGVYLCVSLIVLFMIAFYVLMSCSPGFQAYVKQLDISRTGLTFITLFVATIAYFIVLLFDYFRSMYAIYRCNLAINRINGLYQLWTNFFGPNSWLTKIKRFFVRITLPILVDRESFQNKTGRELLQDFIQRRIDRLWPTIDRLMEKFPPLPSKDTTSSQPSAPTNTNNNT